MPDARCPMPERRTALLCVCVCVCVCHFVSSVPERTGPRDTIGHSCGGSGGARRGPRAVRVTDAFGRHDPRGRCGVCAFPCRVCSNGRAHATRSSTVAAAAAVAVRGRGAGSAARPSAWGRAAWVRPRVRSGRCGARCGRSAVRVTDAWGRREFRGRRTVCVPFRVACARTDGPTRHNRAQLRRARRAGGGKRRSEQQERRRGGGGRRQQACGGGGSFRSPPFVTGA